MLHQLCSGFLSRHFTSVKERLPTNNRPLARNPISAARTTKVDYGKPLAKEREGLSEGV